MDNIDIYKYERELYENGYKLIAGVDEVGRGPLIGDVVVACVILPEDFKLEGLTDSKKLSEKKRNIFYEYIINNAISVSVVKKSSQRIDEINIYEATKEAMYESINNSFVKPDYVLIDAMKLPLLDIENKSIIKGDMKSISIAAASVVAKVVRDRDMYKLDLEYKEYDLKNNKGYPTKKHMEAIKKYGITKYHRLSFKPVLKDDTLLSYLKSF